MVNKVKNMFALTETGAKGVVKASVASFFMYIAYILPMMIMMYFVYQVLGDGASAALTYVGGLVIVSIVMYVLINYAYNTTYSETYKEAANLRVLIANTLKSLPLSYFSRHNISDLSQTVMQDVADMEHALSHAIPEIFGFIAYFIFISVGLVAAVPLLGLALISPIIISALLLLTSKKLQVRVTTKYFYKLRENADAFQEAIEMHQEIKSYGQEEKVRDNISNKIEDTEKLHVKTEFAQALPTTCSTTIIRFSLGLTVLVGTILYSSGQLSLLFFVGYIIAATRIIDGISGIYMNMAEVMYLDARIKRIRELYNEPLQEGEECKLDNYDISFKDVTFAYNEDNKVLEGVSFEAKQGEVTALIGPSGCGKTTALRLMSRLYDYDSGSIVIGGRDIKSIDTESLFENISIVFQDVSLFNTSVMDNIRIGRYDATDDEVKEAARMANCEEFIDRLPEGYDTLIGEDGMNLSGGERQRISIARAILKDAPVILLDEISASLDVENEMKIQESLKHLIKGKTVVIISHRLKSVEGVDKIVVMNHGKVESEGRHRELLEKSDLYRTMIERAGMIESYTY